MSNIIYHIVPPDYWQQFSEKEIYTAPTFEEEGFIHCCTKEQIEYVLTTYFVGIKAVLLMKIDTAALDAELKVELANGQHFPHIYGGINKQAIIGIQKIENHVT